MTLWRTFRNDRTFAAVFALLVLAAWLPLWRTTILPFVDLHNNVGAASHLIEAARGGPMARYYAVNWSPVPYWTGYLVMAVGDALGNVYFGAKLVCGVISLLTPLFFTRLLIALGRDHRQGLWAFVLTWERNLYAGWVTYLLGIALAFLALAWVIEAKTWRQALAAMCVSALVALTHAQALAFLGLAGIAATFAGRPSLRKLVVNAVGLSGGLLAIWPWADKILDRAPKNNAGSAFRFIWHTPEQKVEQLFDFTFGNFKGEFDTALPTVVFVAICAAPFALGLLRRGKLRSRAPLAPPLVIALAALALYASLPFEIRGPISHKHNYVRYATTILLAMVLVPRPSLRRGVVWLAPAAFALAMDVHVARHLAEFAPRAQPMVKIGRMIKPSSRVLTVFVGANVDPTCKMAPYSQIHSYATARSNSFDPYYFDLDSVPLVYRKGKGRPPEPDLRKPGKISWDKHIRHYDYVIVQGLEGDPFRGRLKAAPVQQLFEGGMWRLYSVNRKGTMEETAP
jgi:hypothetical protein